MIKKILMVIPYFILWFIYVILTRNEREMFMVGTTKNMQCVKMEDKSLFIKGTTTEYTFNPNKKPIRNYITWKEFWSMKGY